ncbi:MAG TPA: hypothetical protein VK457_05740, partial [Chloroflexota bacterium]|nr:hypothetical protein [Chloroflexota bacterium]
MSKSAQSVTPAAYQALLRLSLSLAEETEVSGLASRLAEQLPGLLPVTSWELWMKASDGGLDFVAAQGSRSREQQGRHHPPGMGVTGRVMSSGLAELVDDV